MSATKTWNIGDVLTASDLNSNFSKLPYSTYSFGLPVVGAVAANSQVTYAVVYPTGRFSVTPNVTVSTTDPYLTGYVSSVNAGTVTLGWRNNGNATSGAAFVVYCISVQGTSGSAIG